MDKFIIQGGQPLQGEIAVCGAKNHALKMFAVSLLSDQTLTLRNVPEIEDIFRIAEILESLGVEVQHPRHGVYKLQPTNKICTVLPKKQVPKLRASILLAGPLLARHHTVTLPHPGGCAIGKRPIDLFVHAFQAMGAHYRYTKEQYRFTVDRHGLQGARYVFPIVSVTGTETMLLAAVLAHGTTTIVNAAREPEVVALAEYLISQGAKISGAGTSSIVIHGVKRLRAGVATIIPDRIETLSFIFLALATKSQLTITRCEPAHVEVPLQLMRDSGARFIVGRSTIQVRPWKKLQPLQVVTREYPGFPTDGQSPLTVLLTQILGESSVMETIYADRLFFTDMLNRMGANIQMHTSQHITIHGGTTLNGKIVDSPDLRAGIAMVIAGAAAKGKTEIGNIYQIDRGYEQIDCRLQAIGLKIVRQHS
ncbi:MAG: UDP-N-acetylglucosamine 1-carboxyvinyltransferase [uncultured bacterium]|nr:MAG: UDP-N-acetylglucosamine 1-carboxyvinyltransferase [uncultured bacterium]